MHEQQERNGGEVPAGLQEKLDQIQGMQEEIEALKNKMEGMGDKDDDYFTYVTADQVDGKIQNMLEQLKNDNQMLWKETVQMAEKQFNSKGI